MGLRVLRERALTPWARVAASPRCARSVASRVLGGLRSRSAKNTCLSCSLLSAWFALGHHRTPDPDSESGCSSRTTTARAAPSGRRPALAAAGHHRLPAHGRRSSSSGASESINALDEAMSARQGDLPRRAEERQDQRARRRKTSSQVGTLGTIMQLLRLPDGTVKVLVEGKQRARDRSASSQTDEFFLVEVEEIAETSANGVEVEALMRSVQATFEMLREAQQEDPARDADERADDRRCRRASPTRSSRTCRPSSSTDRQALLEIDGSGEAPRAALRADAGRDRDPPGREEDPLARQEADGEDAEGVLPQRADAGDPEGAGWRRARRVQERDSGDRREAQDQADEQRGAAPRSRRSSRSSR